MPLISSLVQLIRAGAVSHCALTLVGALITPVVETISTAETKSYGGR